MRRPCTIIIVNNDNNRRNPRLRITLFVLLALLEKPHKLRRSLTAPSVHNNKRLADESCNNSKPLVREVSDTNRPWDANEASNDGNSPLRSIDTPRLDLERATADEDDGDLKSDDQNHNADEEEVAEDAFKHIELVVETSVVEDVEDLHPDKTVENDSVELQLFVGIRKVVAEDVATGEVENEYDCELVDVLAGDLLPHGGSDQWLVSALRRAIKDLFCRWVCGESKSCESVHDQVYPKQLYGSECGPHLTAVHGSHKGQDYSGNIDRDLKLCWLVHDLKGLRSWN
jgi:hypothetical protein